MACENRLTFIDNNTKGDEGFLTSDDDIVGDLLGLVVLPLPLNRSAAVPLQRRRDANNFMIGVG